MKKRKKHLIQSDIEGTFGIKKGFLLLHKLQPTF
jgi:hypothetical protein